MRSRPGSNTPWAACRARGRPRRRSAATSSPRSTTCAPSTRSIRTAARRSLPRAARPRRRATRRRERVSHMSDQPSESEPPGVHDAEPRAAFAQAFFAVFLADWREGGKKAIEAMRKDKPGDYVKLAAALLPKDLAVKTEPIDELTDAEIAARIAQLAESQALARPGGAGAAGEEGAA